MHAKDWFTQEQQMLCEAFRKAVEHEDDWLLNGSKTYISNGINGDLFVTAAKTDLENNRCDDIPNLCWYV